MASHPFGFHLVSTPVLIYIRFDATEQYSKGYAYKMHQKNTLEVYLCYASCLIQIKYGLPYSVTCPSLSMDPLTRVRGEAEYPGAGIPGSVWILGQLTRFWQNIFHLYYNTGWVQYFVDCPTVGCRQLAWATKQLCLLLIVNWAVH